MLTKEQIDHLFEFCRAKGATYYDVQVELVDHLANAIEKELAEHPGWSFEKALDVVFISFGYTDFKPLVGEKQKAAQAYCRRLWWSLFREQLRRPATWAAFGVFLFIHRIMARYDPNHSFNACITGGLLILFVILAGNYRLKGLQKRMGKRFLLINLTELTPLLGYSTIALGYVNTANLAQSTALHFMLVGTLNFVYFLLCLAYYRTVKRLEKQVKRDYSDVFTVA